MEYTFYLNTKAVEENILVNYKRDVKLLKVNSLVLVIMIHQNKTYHLLENISSVEFIIVQQGNLMALLVVEMLLIEKTPQVQEIISFLVNLGIMYRKKLQIN